MQCEVNYKEKDRVAILRCLEAHGGRIDVEELIATSGADKLRVYPLLMELELGGVIKTESVDIFGAPKCCTLLIRRNAE